MEAPVNEGEMLAAVLLYQTSRSDRDAEAVLRLADPLIHGMLGRAVTVRGVDFAEAYSRVQVKVWKALKNYRPESGRIFSYLNAVVQNYTRTICNEQLRKREPCERIEETEELPIDAWRSGHALEDIRHRLRCLRTICTRSNEIEAQRWLVNSLIRSEFTIPRHEAVRALRIVYSVDLKQGRLIHDRTMLELRRMMLAGRRNYPAINISVLKDKRERGLLKFKPFLSRPNFDKLVFLMRGLAPVIITDLIEREIRGLNGDGTPARKREVVRKYLHAALDGFPESQPLFPDR